LPVTIGKVLWSEFAMGRRIASAACFCAKGVARIETQANSDDAAIVDLDQRSNNRIVQSIQFAKFVQTEGSGVRAKHARNRS